MWYYSRFRLLLPVLACTFSLSACGSDRPRASQSQRGKELTPAEFLLLSDEEKIRYRDITLRIPEAWGGSLLPFSKGPYASVLDKAVHSGELEALMAQYNRALFELEHPRVKVEFVNFDMWSSNFKSVLAVSLASHRAPSVYIARDLPQTIEQGVFADITDLVKNWDQRDRQPEGSVREGTVNGRAYTVPANELGSMIIRYRKDWFREAGIFNEYGEPGPRTDWTWNDFREIAKKVTDPQKKRWGFAGQTNDFFYNDAHGLRLYIPDRTGKHTWRFNDQDPRVIDSLKAARALVRDDQSVSTSVTLGWFEWHAEFDASRAAMIISHSAHLPKESLDQPDKFGKDKPFRETVGMVPPPRGPSGLSGFKTYTNNFGFDPTLSPEELQAAFDWTTSLFYGPTFVNQLRATIQQAKVQGKRSSAYGVLLANPYKPVEEVLSEPLEEIFPANYLRMYDLIRKVPAAPLPREFGLREPPPAEFEDAVRAMYSEAVTSKTVDLQALVGRTANIVNRTMLSFGAPDDREKLQRFHAALGEFYRRHYPEFYRRDWPPLYERYYRVD